MSERKRCKHVWLLAGVRTRIIDGEGYLLGEQEWCAQCGTLRWRPSEAPNSWRYRKPKHLGKRSVCLSESEAG